MAPERASLQGRLNGADVRLRAKHPRRSRRTDIPLRRRPACHASVSLSLKVRWQDVDGLFLTHLDDRGVRGGSHASQACLRLSRGLPRSLPCPLRRHSRLRESHPACSGRRSPHPRGRLARIISTGGNPTRASHVRDRAPRDAGTSRRRLRQDQAKTRGVFTHRPA